MLMEASLSRESAVIATEIWEENSKIVLRRHYFILALDA